MKSGFSISTVLNLAAVACLSLCHATSAFGNQCQNIFSARVRASEPAEEAFALREVHKEFAKLLRDRLDQEVQPVLSKAELKRFTRELTAASERFLIASNIPYKLKIVNRKARTELGLKKVEVPVFTLSGSRDGSPTARLIWAIQNNPRIATSVKIQFSPMEKLIRTSFGYYQGKKQKINVGVDGLLGNFLGLRNTLRHEAAHFFEDVKKKSGQLTMDRIDLAEGSGRGYGSRFSGSEVETHLRDLRFLLNASRRNDSKFTPKQVEFFDRQRAKTTKLKIDLLDRMILDIESAIKELREKEPTQITNEETNDLYLYDLTSSEYKEIWLEVPRSPDLTQAQSLKQTLDYLETRASAIRSQLDGLVKKLN